MLGELKKLQEQLDGAVGDIKSLVSKQEEEIATIGKSTEETGTALTKATERLDELKGTMEAQVEERKKDDERIADLEKRLGRMGGSLEDEVKSLGAMFIDSKQFKAAVENGQVNIDPVTMGRSLKELTSQTGSAGHLNQPLRRPEIFRDPADRAQFIRDLIPNVPTTDGAVEIIEEAFTNNAGPQADSSTGSARGAGEMVAKRKSNLSYNLKDVKIRTMAHWIPAARQILADAPRLRGEIDSRLIYGLMLLSDDQLLFGTGTGQNLEGLMVNSGVSDIGGLAAGTSAGDIPGGMIDHIRKAVTQCQINEYRNINGTVLAPEDWETIELAKGSDGHYIWVSVPTGGGSQLWRVPVVVSNAQEQGEFILGDWQMGATLYDREQVSVRVSEHHADFFIENAIAILAEERIGLGVHRPLAFTKGSFDVESG